MAAPINVNIGIEEHENNTNISENEDDSCDFMSSLSSLAEETMTYQPVNIRREECRLCSRPVKVCWCPYLPKKPIETKTNLYILQHPYEETRCLRTAPMLVRSLPAHKCHLIQGKKYPRSKFPDLEEVINSQNTLLLFPGPDAVNIEDIPNDVSTQYNLVVIDGTWQQARGIYYQNPMLHIPKKVQINYTGRSKYSIRTQPNDHSLSTLESVALALSILENKPDIVDILTKPLEALVKFQLDHGAKAQQSRDYKIKNGLWTKRLPKSVLKKREREAQNPEPD